jgi:sigma-B regulation protein RsbQ
MPDRLAGVIRRNNVRTFDIRQPDIREGGATQGGETILFAHGFGTDQTAWTPQIAPLQGNWRCVSFDHVGASPAGIDSFNPRRYSSLYSYAQDLIEVCDALGLRGVRLVGHSVSGMVSMIAAMLRPELFKSLLVIGASPRYVNDPETGYYGGFDRAAVDSLFDTMTANYHAWASGFAPMVMGNPERPELAEYFCETLLSIRPDVAQAVLKVIFLSDHRTELAKVAVPVWLLAAREDPAVPDSVGDFLAAHLPHNRLVRLKATGHLPHISAPHEVNGVIEEWLQAPVHGPLN